MAKYPIYLASGLLGGYVDFSDDEFKAMATKRYLLDHPGAPVAEAMKFAFARLAEEKADARALAAKEPPVKLSTKSAAPKAPAEMDDAEFTSHMLAQFQKKEPALSYEQAFAKARKALAERGKVKMDAGDDAQAATKFTVERVNDTATLARRDPADMTDEEARANLVAEYTKAGMTVDKAMARAWKEVEATAKARRDAARAKNDATGQGPKVPGLDQALPVTKPTLKP